jgi:hypothetical protein
MTSFQDLVDRLGVAVPARAGVPTEAQYEQAVRDAVADFSRRCPVQQQGTLQIRTGVARYTLPADFLRLIKIQTFDGSGGIAITDQGIVPLGTGAQKERYTIAGQTITFTPTPGYTASRQVWYAGAHILESGSYPYLTDDEATILLLKAQADVLQLQAQAALSAGEVTEYQIGDERIKKTSVGQGFTAQSEAMEQRYLSAVRSRIGLYGARGGR